MGLHPVQFQPALIWSLPMCYVFIRRKIESADTYSRQDRSLFVVTFPCCFVSFHVKNDRFLAML